MLTVFEILKDIFLAIWSGILAGLSDMINWSKAPREAPPDPDSESKSWIKYIKNKEWRHYIISESSANIIVVLILLIFIRAGIGEPRYIPSESMEPTLLVGDSIFVEKISKHFRNQYNRGDIVVFFPPAAAEGKEVLKNDPLNIFFRLTGFPFFPQPVAYIKRIIGLPGETIEVYKNQAVFIDGLALKEPYLFGSTEYIPDYGTKKIKIPEGHYFVMGDNRNHSHDSHIWGFLAHDRIVGRAAFVFRPKVDFLWFKAAYKAPYKDKSTIEAREARRTKYSQ